MWMLLAMREGTVYSGVANVLIFRAGYSKQVRSGVIAGT
jgi:hypothetical protein